MYHGYIRVLLLLSLYIYIYIYIYIFVYLFLSPHLSIYLSGFPIYLSQPVHKYLCISLYIHIFTFTNTSTYISILVRVFADGSEDWSSIPDRVIRKTQKMVLDTFLLYTQHYKVWIKGQWTNPGKGAVPFSRPQCSIY